VPKILHTADLQLDAPFGFLGQRGDAHRQQLRETFRKVVETARSHDLLLIAGDLFDSNHPSRATVAFVQQQLQQLSIPVCILPGNHDCYDAQSIYRREKFPANVRIFAETPTFVDFPELNLTVAGNPLRNNYATDSVFDGITRSGGRQWFVVMAHGNLQIPGLVENTARPIKPAALEATRADYVALGDWHAFADYSQGKVKAYYAGAPEPTGSNQSDAGYVASVHLSAAGVMVERVRVGRTFTREVKLNVMNMDMADILREIGQHADPACMLTVTLTGMKSVDRFIDTESITSQLGGGFYWLQVNDTAVSAVDHIDPAQFPATQVIGQYVRNLKGEIDRATDERQRRIAEQALQIGVALLQGKEVLR